MTSCPMKGEQDHAADCGLEPSRSSPLPQLLTTLRNNGVRVWVDGRNLRYSAPKGALTPDLKAALAAHKQALLAVLAAQPAAIVPVPRPRAVPLSFAQRRLWFLEQLEPGRPTYNMGWGLRLRGDLDVEALCRTFEEVVRRHEVLRTTFTSTDGEPLQVANAPSAWVLPVDDLRDRAAPEREAGVARRMASESERAFSLEAGPLLRTSLLRLTDAEHVLLVTMHHIVSDGWSMDVLVGELSAIYEALRDGRLSPLEPLPVQYADYAIWQRKYLQGEVMERQLGYWKERLAGAVVLELPTDRPRPPVQTYHGAALSFEVSPEVTNGLRAAGRNADATLFMTLMAAFQVLLRRYTGQDDVSVGVPIANRTQRESEGLIGFFVNTLVVRTDLGGRPTFVQVLSRVKEALLGAYAHQDVPFERLVEELGIERDQSRSPLFQAMLTVQSAGSGALPVMPGLTVEHLSFEHRVAKFDLTVSFDEGARGLTGWFEYNTDLFDRATVEQMTRHLGQLLAEIAAAPQRPISDLALLTEVDRDQIVVRWNDTRATYPKESCIHELFESQAARTPDAVAVVFGDEELTYGALNRRANHLARHLRDQGLDGAEPLVGLCVERSIEMVVGLLGILKAGAAYVPLDPEYPPLRLTFMLGDAGIQTLVTQTKYASLLGPLARRCVNLDELDWRSDRGSLGRTAGPDNLAYVIYTSGSTGRPKGVLLEHRGLCNLATAQARAFQLTPASRVLQVASLSFDASIWEVVMALCSGGSLCLARREDLVDPDGLAALCRKMGVNVATIPPSLLATLDPGAFPGLQTLIVAGETCPPAQAQRWMVGRRFFNAYGPSEATVCASLIECRPGSLPPMIGRPIENTQLYVVDEDLQPVPIGVAGELLIGGVGLARGYLNRPDLTEEKFVASPFASEPAHAQRRPRLYRTGDLARYRFDGNIEFLGRVDRQVKIRGHRVELGEIEKTIGAHDSVRDVAVVARDAAGAGGEKSLVAYVVRGAGGGRLNARALRQHLKMTLPEHMIPSAFVFLEALPLTPSGKVDRKALPAPLGGGSEASAAYVAPRTPHEEAIAAIWRELLGVEQVSVHANFFEVGGHSLMATRVAARIRSVLGVAMPLRAFFDWPTVAELASQLEGAQPKEAPSPPSAPPSFSGPAAAPTVDSSPDSDGAFDKNDAPPNLVAARYAFQPSLTTATGELRVGRAVAIKAPLAPSGVLVLSCIHIFGPDSGFPGQLSTNELAHVVQRAALIGLDGELLPIGRPIAVPGAKAFTVGDAASDLALFDAPADLESRALELATVTPSVGDSVWLLARLVTGALPTTLLHRAHVRGSDGESLRYEFDDNTLDLTSTSGGPILNARGQLVGLNLGGALIGSHLNVFANPITSIRKQIELALVGAR